LKVCKAGDVAAGTGKAFNDACFDRVDPFAHHNNGNRLGPFLCRLDRSEPCCDYDDIDLETHQFRQKLRGPIAFPIHVSVLGGNGLSFYVT
jgi:hypothetical protein